MAELCVHLVPLFNALPTNDQMQIEELVHHQNYQRCDGNPRKGHPAITENC